MYPLLHDVWMLKMIPQSRCALNPRIRQRTYLFAVKLIPFSAMKLLVKIWDEFGMNEIYEGVANITVIVVVNGKIEKVKFHFVLFELFKQEFLRILVWDISDHKSCTAVHFHISEVNPKFKGFFLCNRPLFPFKRLIAVVIVALSIGGRHLN